MTEAFLAAQIASQAAASLHLAVQGMANALQLDKAGPAQIEALEWLASLTADMAEAALAYSAGTPLGRPVLQELSMVAAACAAIAPVHPAGMGEG